MKIKILLSALLSLSMLSACDQKAANVKRPSPVSHDGANNPGLSTSPPQTATTPVPSPSTPKNGDYPGKGVVTKIDLELGSVAMNHEEIKGVMPAMPMEFYVSDKAILKGLKVGDEVDFVLRYKDHTEIIISIKKAK